MVPAYLEAMLLRRYFWVLNLVIIALCALFLARGLSRLALAAYQPASKSIPLPRMTHDNWLAAPEIKQIVARNIFCSTCKPAQAEPAEESSVDRPPAADNLLLIATLTSEDPEWSFAVIKDTTESETDLYAIESTVPSGAMVAAIHPTKVLLRRGDRETLLEFDKGTPAAAKARAKKPRRRLRRRPMPQMRGLAKGIRKVGSHKWEIDRSALNKVLSNTTLIARSARIVPSVKHGKPNGFKLLRIRPGAFYSLLGMANGDTVHAINGHPITTPDKALEVYTKLRSAGHVTLSFTRRGKPRTHEYIIR